MTCCPVPCQKSTALTWLMCPDSAHVAASVKVLCEEAQEIRGSLAGRFLEDSKAEEYIKVLKRLIDSNDVWLCSTAVYILGVLLETEALVQNLQEWTHGDNDICRTLGQLLLKDEPDIVLNAAGAIASLVETSSGRQWLLQDHSVFDKLLENVTYLLNHERESAVNSAALILARLSLCEMACNKLAAHSSAFRILSSLAQCLTHNHTDTAMNAAFTIGRLCGSEPGRSLILTVAKEYKLCLSLSPSMGLELQEELSACLRKLKRLPKPSPIKVQHLQSGAYKASWERLELESGLEVTYSLLDGDTLLYCGSQCQMTLPQSHFQPKQSLSLRLNLSTSDGDTSPFSDPVKVTVENTSIRPGAPHSLRVIGCTANLVRLCWMEPKEEVKPKSYQVYCDDVLVETTTELGSTVILSPNTTHVLSVCALGPGDTAGPRSCIAVQTDEGQDHAPSGLVVTVLGRHELHISWGAPATPLGRLFNYELRLNGCVVYLGTERSYTARRLSANTAYTCTVTAITSRGRCQGRPVTKRTARNEYLNTNRCLYSPSRLAMSQPLPSPPVAREVAEVKTKVRKSLLPHRRLPEVQLPIHHFRNPDLRQDRYRLPSVSVQTHTTGKSKCNLTSGVQKIVSHADKLDVNAAWNNAKESLDVGVVPLSASDRPLILHCKCSEPPLRPQCQASPPLDSTHHRQKTSPAVLLQWGSGRTASDRGRLPHIGQHITESVRLLQPVSYNWPDLDRTKHHIKTHRNRLATGSRVQHWTKT